MSNDNLNTRKPTLDLTMMKKNMSRNDDDLIDESSQICVDYFDTCDQANATKYFVVFCKQQLYKSKRNNLPHVPSSGVSLHRENETYAECI